MTDVTKEDFEALSAKFDALPSLFVTALQDAGFGAAPAATVTEGSVEGANAEATSTNTNTDTTEVNSQPEAVVVDHAAIVEALRTNELPGVVAGAVIAEVQAGKSVEDAVKAQVELREALVASKGESGSVHLQESDKGGAATGLARAITVLK